MIPDVVIDVGNTRVKWGLVRDGRIAAMASLGPEDPAAWQAQFQDWKLAPEGLCVISGVNPGQETRLADWFMEQGFNTRIASHKDLPLRVAVDAPEKTGIDRLLNAVAVNTRRRPGSAAIVVDAGSAVTVDLVDEQGIFRGGAIFPGLHLMARALNQYTAKLPLVDVKRRSEPPGAATKSAIEAGVFHAVLGGMESLVRSLQARCKTSAEIFFGGGDAEFLAPHLGYSVTLWPEMTLEGLLRAVLA